VLPVAPAYQVAHISNAQSVQLPVKLIALADRQAAGFGSGLEQLPVECGLSRKVDGPLDHMTNSETSAWTKAADGSTAAVVISLLQMRGSFMQVLSETRAMVTVCLRPEANKLALSTEARLEVPTSALLDLPCVLTCQVRCRRS
jgi:hypothetical protein